MNSDSTSEHVDEPRDESSVNGAGTAIGIRKTSSSSSKTKKKRRSRYDILEEKMNSKLDNVNEKFDTLITLFQAKNCAENGDKNSEAKGLSQRQPEGREREQTQSLRRELSENENSDDNVSIRPRDDEILGESDNEWDTKSSDEEHLSVETKKCLFDLFGDDALTKKSEKKMGIEIDEAQKQVLLNSWRAEHPNLVSAFAEESKDDFPVHEDTEKILLVPTIDDLISRCLIKKHGKKASLTKGGKCLFSQPSKMIEKIAYRGQQAAYMGIVMHMYMQQGLGALMQTLQSDNVDSDKAIQQVRDVFAMSTKSLDQVGRTGTFHHIVRRQVAMTDTGLYEIDEARDLSDLPLSADGVFGSDFEKFLKTRKEKNKALDDLLPDISVKKSYLGKRKTVSSSEASGSKKPYVVKDKTESSDRSGYSNKPNFNSRQFEKKVGHSETKNEVPHFRIPKFKRGASNSRGGKTSGYSR
ncbi:uncharacterized protein [Mytilus edulis]|uniref:uncharacterized protein n=1 Tax=Mytilus edulis TaxID=6550 RepID=UPI0039EF697E